MVKRKPKRRPQHRTVYYLRKLSEDPGFKTVLALRSEAAKQSKRLISDEEFEKIFWQAQALLDKKG